MNMSASTKGGTAAQPTQRDAQQSPRQREHQGRCKRQDEQA
jgi:hypothetical protein